MKAGKIKDENNGAPLYFGSSLTVLNQCNVFIGQLVQNDRNAVERCVRSGPKSEQKHITKESVRLHNHSTRVTIDYISKANVLMWSTCSTVNTSL